MPKDRNLYMNDEVRDVYTRSNIAVVKVKLSLYFN
jgi:hypothetical protein